MTAKDNKTKGQNKLMIPALEPRFWGKYTVTSRISQTEGFWEITRTQMDQ